MVSNARLEPFLFKDNLIMAYYTRRLQGLTSIERLFVAVIKMTIRREEYAFFHNGKCERLADYLGVDVDIANLIKRRVKNRRVAKPSGKIILTLF